MSQKKEPEARKEPEDLERNLGARLRSGINVRPPIPRPVPETMVASSDTLKIHPQISSRYLNEQLNVLTANGKFKITGKETRSKLWHLYQTEIMPQITEFDKQTLTFDQLLDFLQNEFSHSIDYTTKAALRFIADPSILGHAYLHKDQMVGEKIKDKWNTSWRSL